MSGTGRRHGCGDRGSAVVEFVGVGLVLLLPVLYLVIVIARVQSAALATDAAARDAVLGVLAASGPGTARTAAREAAAVTLADRGFPEGDRLRVDLSCDATPCPGPGALVTVDVGLTVPLPGLPALPAAVPLELTVHARQVGVAGRFRPWDPL